MLTFAGVAFIVQPYVYRGLGLWIDDRLVAFPLSWLLTALPLSLLLPRPEGVRAWAGNALGFSRRHGIYLAGGLTAGAGLAGGIVLIQYLGGWITFVSGAERVSWASADPIATLVLSLLVFTAAASGEEVLLRGYGFQQLSRALTPTGAACASALTFGALHVKNPGSSGLAVLNTAEFGLLFGLALARHRSLWLPLGVHLGWNLLLGFLGVRISGLTISVFGLNGVPGGSEWWSGGSYGPEASLLTTASVGLALWLIWRAPVLDDDDRLIWDSPAEGPGTPVEEECESSPTPASLPSPRSARLRQP